MSEAAQGDLETTPIREAHRFDVKRLEAFCQQEVEGFGGDLEVRQFEGGQSNPTFLLTTTGPGGGKRYVMRKKPPGQLLASAHQVDREYRVMKALADTDVPVPHMYALCEDDSIIGTSFYVMEYLEGRVFRESVMPESNEAERRAVYANLAENLAKLHAVDYEKVGLADFGKPGNYFERQIGRWIKQYRGAQTADVPAMEKLIDYLPKHIPDEPSVTIAHGDYRLGNTMFHASEPRMIAVLDWELCTIGHPLADVAYTCMYDLLGVAGVRRRLQQPGHRSLHVRVRPLRLGVEPLLHAERVLQGGKVDTAAGRFAQEELRPPSLRCDLGGALAPGAVTRRAGLGGLCRRCYLVRKCRRQDPRRLL